MSDSAKSFFKRLVVTTLAVFVAEKVLEGIHARSFGGLLAASILLGLFNAFLRPVMMLLALPLLIFTLGLFTLIINACLLYLVGMLLSPDYFVVSSFGAAFLGGLIISLVSFAANMIIGREKPKPGAAAETKKPIDSGGSGPVIDV